MSAGRAQAKLELTVQIDTPCRVVHDVIVDFARYREFIPELASSSARGAIDNGKQVVDFEIEMIVRIDYSLVVRHEGLDLEWSLHESPHLLRNNGAWRLQEQGSHQTVATYQLDLALRGGLPKSVERRLVEQSLPATLSRFRERAETLYASKNRI